ncbi:hypothetical protein [Sphingomonas faeni]|uniref:hypothetical protein n=1 Tax=Sphingomonas faeni TaxID=185950 RepID=UPI003359B5A9
MFNTPVAERASTAHIKIPGAKGSIGSSATPSSTRFYEELKELLWACAPSADRHQLVTIGIKAFIGEGIDTKGQLIAVLVGQGFKRGHIAHILKHDTGSNADTHEWSENANGQFRVLS